MHVVKDYTVKIEVYMGQANKCLMDIPSFIQCFLDT